MKIIGIIALSLVALIGLTLFLVREATVSRAPPVSDPLYRQLTDIIERTPLTSVNATFPVVDISAEVCPLVDRGKTIAMLHAVGTPLVDRRDDDHWAIWTQGSFWGCLDPNSFRSMDLDFGPGGQCHATTRIEPSCVI